MVERGRAKVVFQLPMGAERPRLLRLDLSEEPGMVTVLAIRLRNSAGVPLMHWPANEGKPDPDQMLPVRDANPHTLVLKGGMVLAATADPGVVLDLPNEVLKQLDPKAELELEAIWQLLPQDLAAAMLESKRKEYAEPASAAGM